VLEFDAEDTMRLPYRERRELLESLDFAGVCEFGPRFDDCAALWQAVRKHRLDVGPEQVGSADRGLVAEG
jgi:ATP-dependent DNA ligase